MLTNTAPTRQGRVVMTADVDYDLIRRHKKTVNGKRTRLYANAPVSDVTLSINVGDLCMVRNHGKLGDTNTYEKRVRGEKRRKMVKSGHGPPKVFSRANGLCVTANAGDGDQKDAVRKDYKFVGCSDTEVKLDNSLQKTGVALHLGGTRFVFNTSTQNIKAWQKVIWDLPDSSNNYALIEGVDRYSIPFVTKPFDPYNVMSWTNMMKIFEDNNAGGIVTFPEDKKAWNKIGDEPQHFFRTLSHAISAVKGGGQVTKADLMKFKNAFYTMGACHAEQRERVIGVSLTSAGPGAQMDLWLGKYM